MSVKDGKNSDQVAAERRAHEEGIERAQWAQLFRTAERCKQIAEVLWNEDLDDAQAIQQALSEDMRDRHAAADATWDDGAIPVPLFTPRDRMQFLKEFTTTLLISADRRNLRVEFPTEEVTRAPTKPQVDTSAGIEAASGTYEATLDPETPTVTAS